MKKRRKMKVKGDIQKGRPWNASTGNWDVLTVNWGALMKTASIIKYQLSFAWRC